MHARTVTRIVRIGLLAAVLSGTAIGHAWADGTPPPPVIVAPVGGHGVQIVVNSPGAGPAPPPGNGDGAGGGGGAAVPAGSGGAYQGGSTVSSNPFFMGYTPVDPTTGLSAPCPAAGPAVCSVPQQPPVAPGVAAPAASPPPSAFSLAVSAWGELVMPSPVPSRYPSGTLKESGHPYTIVNANTWFWTDPGTWQPVSKTVTAGAVWGKATASPVSLSFAPGDGIPDRVVPRAGVPMEGERADLARTGQPAGLLIPVLEVQLGGRRRRPGHCDLHDHLERHLDRLGRNRAAPSTTCRPRRHPGSRSLKFRPLSSTRSEDPRAVACARSADSAGCAAAHAAAGRPSWLGRC